VDYAFAPGQTDFDKMLGEFYARRPDTTLIGARGLKTVAQFLEHLESTAAIDKPTGDLFIVSHGNDRAWMKIKLDDQADANTTYEVVEKAVTSGSVRLAADINHDLDGTLASTSLNFRGCRIGDAEPFVDKLKEAFGGESPVTAPKHFDDVYKQPGIGSFESLSIGFELIRPEAIADKAAAIDEFKGEAFTFLDGSLVPDDIWDKWIPRNVTRTGHRDVLTVYLELGRTIGALKKLRGAVEFRHDVPTFTFTISGLASLPAKDDRLDTLRQGMNSAAATANSNWADAHPLPMFKRYGFDSIDEFVDGFTWAFSWNSKKKLLIANGRQHMYTVVVPITNPPDLSTGKLVYNFAPVPGGGDPATAEMLTSDGSLFYTA